MPIVRIDLIEGKSEEYRAQVGEIVYQTLVDVLNVPKGDRFQVITEHRKSALGFIGTIWASIAPTIVSSFKSRSTQDDLQS